MTFKLKLHEQNSRKLFWTQQISLQKAGEHLQRTRSEWKVQPFHCDNKENEQTQRATLSGEKKLFQHWIFKLVNIHISNWFGTKIFCAAPRYFLQVLSDFFELCSSYGLKNFLLNSINRWKVSSNKKSVNVLSQYYWRFEEVKINNNKKIEILKWFRQMRNYQKEYI